VNIEIDEKLWNIDMSNRIYSRETWCEIINELLQDLCEFTGDQFKRKPPVNIDVNEPSFSQWIIRKELGGSFFSTAWSGVISGGIVAQNNNTDAFVVSITFFLFDVSSKKRLYLSSGESIIEFVFKKQSDDRGIWINSGWLVDENDEWDNIEWDDFDWNI
jgi:hypothetical protein